MKDGTQPTTAATKVIMQCADHGMTLSLEYLSAKVDDSVRYTAQLTEAANARPLSGARIRLNAQLASLGKEGYFCSMHPEVTAGTPGNCPKCGMELQKQHRLEEQVDPKDTSSEDDSWTMQEIDTTGIYSTTHSHSQEGFYTISITLSSIGDQTLNPPFVLTSTQQIVADQGSHTGGMGMNATTMFVVGAAAMALVMAVSWGKWF